MFFFSFGAFECSMVGGEMLLRYLWFLSSLSDMSVRAPLVIHETGLLPVISQHV